MPLELGGSLLKDSYEISVSPTEGDPEFPLKQELLVCSSLGFTHHIAASIRLVSTTFHPCHSFSTRSSVCVYSKLLCLSIE